MCVKHGPNRYYLVVVQKKNERKARMHVSIVIIFTPRKSCDCIQHKIALKLPSVLIELRDSTGKITIYNWCRNYSNTSITYIG